MVKAKVLSSALLALVLVGGSAVVAQAGGAGAGSGVAITLFDCYVIHDGANSPYRLTVNDEFGTREHVRLGKARLLCTPTTPDPNGGAGNQGATVERGPALNGSFDGGLANSFKCYDVNPDLKGPNTLVTIRDPFGDEHVGLRRLTTLCAPAYIPTPE
jgi:hypothetical protein